MKFKSGGCGGARGWCLLVTAGVCPGPECACCVSRALGARSLPSPRTPRVCAPEADMERQVSAGSGGDGAEAARPRVCGASGLGGSGSVLPVRAREGRVPRRPQPFAERCLSPSPCGSLLCGLLSESVCSREERDWAIRLKEGSLLARVLEIAAQWDHGWPRSRW